MRRRRSLRRERAVMDRVLVTGFRARTGTATSRDTLATVWAGGIAGTIWTLTPDLQGGLCAGHPYPSPWDAELDGLLESAAQRARRHREAQSICRRCPIMAACLASRIGNLQLGAGVWGGEIFLDKESTAGERHTASLLGPPLPAGNRRSGSPTADQHDACSGESGARPGPCGPPRRTGRALPPWREVSRRCPPGPRRGSV
jgi:Transcription factor WhiB